MGERVSQGRGRERVREKERERECVCERERERERVSWWCFLYVPCVSSTSDVIRDRQYVIFSHQQI